MVVVSIIVPVYNGEKYINFCIESIRRQTLKELEIVIVDDGSADKTVCIVEDWMKSDSRIKLLHQEHGGSGKARNKGLKAALGKYIAFCDADDLYYEMTALEKMVNACEKNRVMVCGSYRNYVGDATLIEGNMFKDLVIPDEEGIGITFADYQDDYNYHSFIFKSFLYTLNRSRD